MIQAEQSNTALFYDWVHPTPTGAHHIAHTIAEHILGHAIPLSSPNTSEDLESMRQIALIWLRSACVRAYDPIFRLEQARSYAQEILKQQPKDELAHGVLKIAENWSQSNILLSPDIRPIFKQQGSCLAVKVR